MKNLDIDWSWVGIILIVLIVMGFNTVRARDRNRLIETCLQQHKSVVYNDTNDIQGCK